MTTPNRAPKPNMHIVEFRGGSRNSTTEILPGLHPVHEFVSPIITTRERALRETEITNFAPLHVEIYKPHNEIVPGRWMYVYYGLRCPHEDDK